MRVLTCLLAVALSAACATARPSPGIEPRTGDAVAPGPAPATLAAFIQKVRTLAAEARAKRPAVHAGTLESSDPVLGAALVAASAAPSPAAYRAVAAAYAARGIFDVAHEYLARAQRLDPADAATYDALARLWRDHRLPHVGLADAWRAVHHGPRWAVGHNTLGTIFQALGRRRDARRAYERALELDPSAAYALNNLCYGWILEGETRKAQAACGRALQLEPGLRAARNNLGLAHGAAGDVRAARAAFEAVADAAGALYNEGVVRLARREYASAVQAFEAAQTLRPAFRLAAGRALQARREAEKELQR